MTLETIQVPQYKTTDGEIFTDRVEAQFHQTTLHVSQEITDYLDTMDKTSDKPKPDRSKAMTRRIILQWEQFKALKESDSVTDINEAV